MKIVVAAVLVVVALASAAFGYVAGGGDHGFRTFKSRVGGHPEAIGAFVAAGLCVAGAGASLVRKRKA